ncbi:MAG: hypothetical protein IPK57_15695 [Chitinophagaceae bacterium]|nr:hypothetical protein [Chitinophagaceae bacterium]
MQRNFNESIREVFAQLAMKKFLPEGYNGQLDMEAFHRRKLQFVLPSFSINVMLGLRKKN